MTHSNLRPMKQLLAYLVKKKTTTTTTRNEIKKKTTKNKKQRLFLLAAERCLGAIERREYFFLYEEDYAFSTLLQAECTLQTGLTGQTVEDNASWIFPIRYNRNTMGATDFL